ncbi:hypothetical protein ACWOEQ_10975 [Enterococcus asini]|uniref:hypothetical protein n=1 Tax=Enterococcus TaxID=1350 RepID=UPI0009002257|nr:MULTISPECIES: hypothetical protein [Enterococcus]OJG12991.1 hypothetical protein RU94_GL001690 [Enterococcus asini]
MGFYELILELPVDIKLAKVYKKAIEGENERYWTQNPIMDKQGNLISDTPKTIWSGNYCHVAILDDMKNIRISLLSRTLPNLREAKERYEKMGAKTIHEKFKFD